MTILDDVFDGEVAPTFLQIIKNQAAVAVMRRVLAAQEASPRQQRRVNFVLDVALLHEPEKVLFIGVPTAFAFFIGIQHRLGRREQRRLDIFHVEDFLQKVFQVIPFAESGELRNLVKTDIHYALYAGGAQFLKKFTGSFFGEANRKDVDGLIWHKSVVLGGFAALVVGNFGPAPVVGLLHETQGRGEKVSLRQSFLIQ